MTTPNRDDAATFENVLERFLTRRGFLQYAGAAAASAALSSTPLGATAPKRPLGFESIPADIIDEVRCAPGYTHDLVISWGDALVPGLPNFDLAHQTAGRQDERFGFNCDFIAFFPMTPGASDHGLLCVNNEYPQGGEMFPDFAAKNPARKKGEPRKIDITPEQIDVQMAAVGMSFVEVKRGKDGWKPVVDSKYNRRITATTKMHVAGPARGSQFVRTNADPTGTVVFGTFANCAGGKTPWGTVLTCEENFNNYFAHDTTKRHATYGVPNRAEDDSYNGWEKTHERFDVAKEPNEPHRFGYVVEIDPYDPTSTPKKRTALGRTKHEGATCALADDGRVVVYSGDDERFQFVYKFVTSTPFSPTKRTANRDLLDEGILYVARFDDDGTGTWLPLVPGGKLRGWTPARIAVQTRQAAKALGATPMDRPEDIEVNPTTHRVYVALTNNNLRKADHAKASHRPFGANPRGVNVDGHILEITDDHGDLASTTFTWQPFLLCGDPKKSEGTYYAGTPVDEVDPISCPDNVAFDDAANLWIATDGQPGSPQKTHDAVFAVPTVGPDRGRSRRFLTAPRGAEICGPEFTPDGTTLFLSIQHPGEHGGLDPTKKTPKRSSWPREKKLGPLPSVIAIRRRNDDKPIGS